VTIAVIVLQKAQASDEMEKRCSANQPSWHERSAVCRNEKAVENACVPGGDVFALTSRRDTIEVATGRLLPNGTTVVHPTRRVF
jgi:hypothetical protein